MMKAFLILFFVLVNNFLHAADSFPKVDRRTFLSEREHGTTRIVHQDEVAFLSPISPYQYIVMGPLKPCQGIIIQYGDYILAYHRSTVSSLQFLPQLVAHMKAKYGIDEAIVPRVMIYSAGLDPFSRGQNIFAATYSTAYAPHYGEVLTQEALMEAVRQEIRELLKIDESRITVDINNSRATYNNYLVAEVLSIDKAGNLAMTWIDDRHCEATREHERFRVCIQAIFALPDFINHRYPPYLSADQAPELLVYEATEKKWPSYKRVCAYCERFDAKGIVGLEGKVIKELPILKVCSRCKDRFYCGTECSGHDWRAGHLRNCKAAQQ